MGNKWRACLPTNSEDFQRASKHDLLDGAEAYHKEVSSGNEAVMVPVLARGLEERFAVKNHG